jgi:hypothetical protein
MKNEEAYKYGKNTLSDIVRGQQAHTLEHNTFCPNIFDLGRGIIPDNDEYSISMVLFEEMRKSETVQRQVTQILEKPIEIDSEQEIELSDGRLIQFKKFVETIEKFLDIPNQHPKDEWMIPLKRINQIYRQVQNLNSNQEIQLEEQGKIQVEEVILAFGYVFDIYGKDEVSREEVKTIELVEKITVQNLAVQIFVRAKREGLKSFTSVVWRNEEIEDEMNSFFTLSFESDQPTQELPPNIEIRSNSRWDEVAAPVGYSKIL